MQYSETLKPISRNVAELTRGAAIREHRSLAGAVDQHHDGAGLALTLCAHIDSVCFERSDELKAYGILSDTSDEASRDADASCEGCDIGGTTSSGAGNTRGVVGRRPEFAFGPDDDVLDEVTDDPKNS